MRLSDLSNFELWVRGCEINQTELWCLEGKGDTALYKLQSKYEVDHNFVGNTPVYIVWINGECESYCTNYREAYDLYMRRAKEEESK